MHELEIEISATRRAVSYAFLRGSGIEVGAGSRPWPLHEHAKCFYGDTRGKDELAVYFKVAENAFDGVIDAQTFNGVRSASLDFVISAHVIEHLQNPVGAIQHSLRVVRPGGIVVVAVPEMTKTFDQLRSPTPLEHLLSDARDGGVSTRLLAYEEHARFVHPYITGDTIPENEIQERVNQVAAVAMDIHFHAWTGATFRNMLERICSNSFTILAHVPVVNENIFVLRKNSRWQHFLDRLYK